MGAPLSEDLRVRVIRAVEEGSSRRQAASRFGVSVSSAIRWVGEWRRSGRTAALPQGGDQRSDRIEAEADFLLAEIEQTPDITLAELQTKLREERGLSVGIGTVWRFFDRRDISFKKNCARRRAGPS
jgi:transposase